ncbi:uncharacterized protein LOC132726951 [Ruditapes philippinarum]|uniref:uncharacterized protein LOC132726951 n=1 Tax=Ruditapes philippinarum TaxID=129788 RepID=UPI00295AEC0B|nr:uncharacterized protein LOC132726951 [Ruditapes philippinarum]
MKRRRRNLIEFILLQCLLYLLMQQHHVTQARCSWGSWLPWNCSCCGNSDNILVYRVRAKCCDNTYECVNVRYAALNITDVNDFEEEGKCLDDCGKLFSDHNPQTCVSSKMNLDEVKGPSKIKSCKYSCVGVWTTTTPATTPTSPSTSSTTNRKATTTRFSTSRASGNTLTTAKSTPEGSSTVSSNFSSNVENVAGPNDTNYGIIGGVIGGLVVMAICIGIGILIWLKIKQTKERRPSELARTRFRQ